MSRPRQDDDTPTDEKSNGTTFVNPDFDNESNSSTDVDSNIFSDRGDKNTDDETSLFDEEEQHSPEYYLTESASLDVSRLRQRRYSPKI